MKLADFRNLDRNNIGGWPQGVKLTFCIILFLLILLGGWYFFITDRQDELKGKQTTEIQLKKDFSDKQAKVVNLKELRHSWTTCVTCCASCCDSFRAERKCPNCWWTCLRQLFQLALTLNCSSPVRRL